VLSTMVTVSIISYGLTVLSAVADSLVFGADTISRTSPGVTLILPGVNIPLIEGILALILILVVHEGAHATLSVIGRVPLVSSGLAFFGVIPVGAFVEPDEKRLVTKSREVQTRVIVAGSTANLFTSVIVFLLLFGFLFITGPFKETGWFVISGMEEETIIHSVNGIEVNGVQQLNLTPGEQAILETSRGTMEMVANEEGMLGISYAPLSYAPYTRYNFFPLDFLFRLLALTFCLNFIIGIVNLLPLPLFDGYRLLELNIESKMIPKAIMWICIGAFLMNFLPWFF
jgi:membrane-associated protease RseP (regulator of RpoE activity)